MSHFTVLVALKPDTRGHVGEHLAAALAPFDENSEVTPYRNYIENWQNAYERALKFYSEHPEHKPAGLDELDVAAVLSAYEDVEVTEETADDSTAVTFYSMSTYNPRSKWDWWVIGGRWTGYFPVAAGCDGDPRLIVGRPGAFGHRAAPGRVDGGPRELLDFDALRQIKAAEAGGQYDHWQQLTDGLPEARPWSAFLERHKADPEDYPIDRAREEYGAQEITQKARTSREFAWLDCPIDAFAVGRDEYMRQAAERAVPGYAYLDLDGVWHAPGSMGWFGMSSDDEGDRAAYYRRINEELDALDPATVLVAVDCHI
jgi:hypothetical protein